MRKILFYGLFISVLVCSGCGEPGIYSNTSSEELLLDTDGKFEETATQLKYISGKEVEEMPDFNITKVYRDTLQFLKNEEQVMIILLDGWGWEMYLKAEQPYLNNLDTSKALSVFPPISPVCLASILTGELPEKHGIHDRLKREPDINMDEADMFAKTAASGKTSIYIENNSNLVKTSITPILSLDLNEQNGTDDEVYANAKKAIEENPHLLFIHFHGIDDIAHEYGPFSPETSKKIKYIDGLVADLADRWESRIIITADHGQHNSESGGGEHGIFCADDMLVPYIVTTGKK